MDDFESVVKRVLGFDEIAAEAAREQCAAEEQARTAFVHARAARARHFDGFARNVDRTIEVAAAAVGVSHVREHEGLGLQERAGLASDPERSLERAHGVFAFAAQKLRNAE